MAEESPPIASSKDGSKMGEQIAATPEASSPFVGSLPPSPVVGFFVFCADSR
ncbi:hypothetical protein U1Q18_041488 [Sarracenia purpurea var. burkii]